MNGLNAGIGPWLVGAGVCATLVVFVLVVRAYQDSRFSPYYLLRQQAGERLRRRMIWLGSLALITVIAAFILAQREPLYLPALALPVFPFLPGAASTDNAATPTPTRASPTATVIRPSPTSTRPSATPTLVAPPTRAATQAPLITGTPGLPTELLTPVTPRATPVANAAFGPLVIAASITDQGYPLIITDTYRTGRFPVYAVFTYTQMMPGVAWTQYWLRGATPVRGETALWSFRTSGRAYVFVNPTEGWMPGVYEVRLYMEERLVQVGRFSVLP